MLSVPLVLGICCSWTEKKCYQKFVNLDGTRPELRVMVFLCVVFRTGPENAGVKAVLGIVLVSDPFD